MTLTSIKRDGLDGEALDIVFTIGASGTDHYTFQGEGLNGTVNDPTLYLTRGKTYRFENGTGAHPIRIQSTSGASGTAYNTGVTNNAGSGTVIVEVQHDAPDVLYYQCTSHAAMNGILYITGALADGGVTEAKLANSAVTEAKIANGAVTTVKIADQAVTLAKLPHGTSSNDGKFLRANNGADPSFETITGTTINNNADNRVITGSGTANTLNAESSVIIDSNGRLGINNTSPDRKLEVQNDGDYAAKFSGGSGSGHTSIEIGQVATNGSAGFNATGGSMLFDIAGAEKMRLNTSGDLLIGKTVTAFTSDGIRANGNGLIAVSRSSTSTVGGTANGASVTLCNPSATDNNFSNVGFYKADGLVTSQINGINVSQSSRHGALSFLTHDGSVLTERMNIDQNGDIVIGTSSWSYKKALNVQGSTGAILSLANYDTTSYAADTNTAIELRVNTGNTGYTNGSCEIRALKENGTNGNNARALSFYTGANGASPSEKLRILSGGGITFNGDTAAANALDDYEEGTYTPTPNSGTTQTSVTDGQYTKIGNFVIVTGSISLSGNGTSGQMVNISIPFTSASGRAGSGVIRYSNASIANTITIHINSGLASMDWYQFGGSGLTYSEASTNRYDFCLTYRTT